MTSSSHPRWIARTAFLCAWLSSLGARLHADFEIESFTRYRLIRMDNNNNGYVDDFDITDQPALLENTARTEVIGSAEAAPNAIPAQSPTPVQITPGVIDYANSNFGSVHTNFRTPGDFLSGLIDINTVATGRNSWSDTAVMDASANNTNRHSGIVYVTDVDNNIIGTGVDFGDLHTFNVAFESFKGLAYLQGRGVQLEKVIRFSPKLPKDQTTPDEPYTSWEVFYGARFYQFADSFTFEGNGSILGHTWADTSVENQHGGPHLGMLWNLRHGRWTFAVSGLAQSGLGATDSRQAGAIGEELSPGRVNSPIYAQPHVVSYQVEDQFNTIYGEVRAQVKRELTKLITMTVGCSGYYFGDIKFADQSVHWFLPDLGVVNGTEDSTITTAFASLEFRH